MDLGREAESTGNGVLYTLDHAKTLMDVSQNQM